MAEQVAEREAEQEENPQNVCTACGKRPARSKGLCQACNMKQRRGNETPRQRANRKEKEKNRRDTAAQHRAAKGEFPTVPGGEGGPSPEWQAPSGLPPLTGEQRDQILIRTATRGPEPVDVSADPNKMTRGHYQLWAHVRSHDAIFRRDIIRRLQALGQDDLSIIATFIAEPSLCERWVDPLRNPKEVFRKDFLLLRKLSKKRSRSSAVSLRDYIERLGLTLRMSFEVASDKDVPATVRKDMLILSGKLARDIALLEDAIKPIPGSGDVPAQSVYKNPDPVDEEGEGDVEDEEGEGDEEDEEETAPGGYNLPHIATGRADDA